MLKRAVLYAFTLLCFFAVSTPITHAQTTAITGCSGGIGVNTAIGCLAVGDPKLLITQLWGWAIGLSGGIAILIIIYAGFQMVTAEGDPKKLQAGQELLTSAIYGLIVIICSVVILNFLGVTVLQIPGFNL